MTIDPDELTNDEISDLDPDVLSDDDKQDVMEARNDLELDDAPPPELPDLDPPPSLDPTTVNTGTAPSGNGWALQFDDDGAVRTVAAEDVP